MERTLQALFLLTFFPTPLRVVLLCFATQSLQLALMAASRLLGAAGACVILLSFAAGHGKSYWSGCIKAAIVICQQIFSVLIFLLKFLFKSAILANSVNVVRNVITPPYPSPLSRSEYVRHTCQQRQRVKCSKRSTQQLHGNTAARLEALAPKTSMVRNTH